MNIHSPSGDLTIILCYADRTLLPPTHPRPCPLINRRQCRLSRHLINRRQCRLSRRRQCRLSRHLINRRQCRLSRRRPNHLSRHLNNRVACHLSRHPLSRRQCRLINRHPSHLSRLLVCPQVNPQALLVAPLPLLQPPLLASTSSTPISPTLVYASTTGDSPHGWRLIPQPGSSPRSKNVAQHMPLGIRKYALAAILKSVPRHCGIPIGREQTRDVSVTAMSPCTWCKTHRTLSSATRLAAVLNITRGMRPVVWEELEALAFLTELLQPPPARSTTLIGLPVMRPAKMMVKLPST